MATDAPALVYILSDHDEGGAETVCATTNPDQLVTLLEQNWPACWFKTDAEHAAFMEEAKVSIILALQSPVPGPDRINLMSGWGGAQLHIVELGRSYTQTRERPAPLQGPQALPHFDNTVDGCLSFRGCKSVETPPTATCQQTGEAFVTLTSYGVKAEGSQFFCVTPYNTAPEAWSAFWLQFDEMRRRVDPARAKPVVYWRREPEFDAVLGMVSARLAFGAEA